MIRWLWCLIFGQNDKCPLTVFETEDGIEFVLCARCGFKDR